MSPEESSSVKFQSKELTQHPAEEDEVIDVREGLGTLTFHADGRARFFGPTAAVEVSYLVPSRVAC
jgi:hypothetical protein